MHSFDAIPDGSPVSPSQPASASPPRTGVSAGFGSPGTDATVKRIDLNDALIRHPQATFTMRASGSATHEAGIDDGDVLLVDRALQPSHGQVVIAIIEGELLCRRLWRQGGLSKLQAANSQHADIVPGDGVQLELWGVVTTVIKSLLD